MSLSAIVSVASILFGLAGILRGWQMRYGGRIDLISDWDSRPLPNPVSLVKAFSRIYLTSGSALCLLPLLLLAGMPLLAWGAITGVVVWVWFYAIESIALRATLTDSQRDIG